LFHVGGRTDVTKLIIAFGNTAKSPKTVEMFIPFVLYSRNPKRHFINSDYLSSPSALPFYNAPCTLPHRYYTAMYHSAELYCAVLYSHLLEPRL